MGTKLRITSQTRITKILLVLFAVLFAAILIHPQWDLPEVHDVRITSARHQSHSGPDSPIHPVIVGIAVPVAEVSGAELLPQLVFALEPSRNLPLLTVLRV